MQDLRLRSLQQDYRVALAGVVCVRNAPASVQTTSWLWEVQVLLYFRPHPTVGRWVHTAPGDLELL